MKCPEYTYLNLGYDLAKSKSFREYDRILISINETIAKEETPEDRKQARHIVNHGRKEARSHKSKDEIMEIPDTVHKHLFIIGRLSGNDENDYAIYKNVTMKEARNRFSMVLHSIQNELDEIAGFTPPHRRLIVEHTFASDSPIVEVWV